MKSKHFLDTSLGKKPWSSGLLYALYTRGNWPGFLTKIETCTMHQDATNKCFQKLFDFVKNKYKILSKKIPNHINIKLAIKINFDRLHTKPVNLKVLPLMLKPYSIINFQNNWLQRSNYKLLVKNLKITLVQLLRIIM